MASLGDLAQGASSVVKVDAAVLEELETQTRLLSRSFERVMENLTTRLHDMSTITVACAQTLDKVVMTAGTDADEAVKSMYMLMAHGEEMDREMVAVKKIHERIKRIKSILPILEARAGILNKKV